MEALTQREKDVHQLLSYGTSNAGIAECMVLRPKSVQKLVDQVMDKLLIEGKGPQRRVQAALGYWRERPEELVEAVRLERI